MQYAWMKCFMFKIAFVAMTQSCDFLYISSIPSIGWNGVALMVCIGDSIGRYSELLIWVLHLK